MDLSPHFSLAEFTISQTASRRGLDNTPGPEVLEHLKVTAAGMEKVRALLADAIHVNSGYRAPEVNAAVHGSPTSAHVKGWACDFICPAFGTPLQICHYLAPHLAELGVDQMIEEGTWVHLSFDPQHRHEVLTLKPGGGYQYGLRPL